MQNAKLIISPSVACVLGLVLNAQLAKLHLIIENFLLIN